MKNDSGSCTGMRFPFQFCLLLRGYSLALVILALFLWRSTGAEIDTFASVVKTHQIFGNDAWGWHSISTKGCGDKAVCEIFATFCVAVYLWRRERFSAQLIQDSTCLSRGSVTGNIMATYGCCWDCVTMRRRFLAAPSFRVCARHCHPWVANTSICQGPNTGSTELNKIGRWWFLVKARLVNLPRLSSVNVVFDSFCTDRLFAVTHIL